MRIAIDISQSVYEGTGVARYVRNLTDALMTRDPRSVFVLFGSSFRLRDRLKSFVSDMRRKHPKTRISQVIIPLPPAGLEFLFNSLHLIPVEWLTGRVDVFWSSDWTQPPVKNALSVTTIHDVSVLRYPDSFDRKILAVQKRRLRRVTSGCDVIFCDSDATRRDAVDLLTIPPEKLYTVYPGFPGSV